jgi:nucleotide-binding universal stress UspA family protein
MFSKILCPIDGSDHSHKALELAMDLAAKYDARLFVIHVPHGLDNPGAVRRFAEIEGLSQKTSSELSRIRSPVSRMDAFSDVDIDATINRERIQIEIGTRLLEGARERALKAGLDGVELRMPTGDPADRILECIAQDGIDCVVMGARGLNDLQGLFQGSVSHKVSSRAPCTCITIK